MSRRGNRLTFVGLTSIRETFSPLQPNSFGLNQNSVIALLSIKFTAGLLGIEQERFELGSPGVDRGG